MESLARLVDESLARYGVQITVDQRWLHAEAIYGSSDDFGNKTENRELETENWVAPQSDVA
jgi:hypothetical protein